MIAPNIESGRASELLAGIFGTSVSHLMPITTGQIARAYSFEVAGEDHVIRFVDAKIAATLRKDRFVAERLASSSVPVPRIDHLGNLGEFDYAIARKAPGSPLGSLRNDLRLVPALIETLDAIHQIDVTDTEGYGFFDPPEVGENTSWSAFLLNVADDGEEGSFYGKWHRYFDETFLDRERFFALYDEMIAMLRFCPEQRCLVHGDYGFGNILAEDGRITAVLDWANALFGDPLYDVAWLDLYSPGTFFKDRMREFYERRGRAVEHYEERIACYQMHVCLDAQRWYVKSDQPDQSEWMWQRVREAIHTDPAR